MKAAFPFYFHWQLNSTCFFAASFSMKKAFCRLKLKPINSFLKGLRKSSLKGYLFNSHQLSDLYKCLEAYGECNYVYLKKREQRLNASPEKYNLEGWTMVRDPG